MNRRPHPTSLLDAPLFLVAVRRDGKRSPVERHWDMAELIDAAKQWAANDAVAYVTLNRFVDGVPTMTHHVVLKGGNAVVVDVPANPGRRRGVVRNSPLTGSA